MYEKVDWATVKKQIGRDWRQGEHVVIIGPTGCGKTTFLTELLDMRKHVMFFGTKVYDDTYNKMLKKGFKRYETWDSIPAWQTRVMLWPKFNTRTSNVADMYAKQRAAFLPALNRMFHERNWTVVLDELHYLTNDLRLGKEIAMYHHQGRSSGLTMVDGFQRPANIPLIVYGSARYAIIWRTKQLDTDAARLVEFGGMNKREMLENMMDLERYEFIMVDTAHNAPPIRSKVKV